MPLGSMPLGPSLVPASAAASRGTGTGRMGRARPGAAVVLLAIAGLVIGAISVAALPGGDDGEPGNGGIALGPTPRPTRTPRPTPEATPTPAPTSTEAAPTATPTDEPARGPTHDVADLCETFFGIPCGLGPGRYSPSRLTPTIDFEVGDGWSVAAHEPDLVTLTRAEGVLTLASGVTEVFPGGASETTRGRSRDLIEAFIATDNVSAKSPARVRIDGRRGLSVDLTPIDAQRIALFATDGTTYFLEPDVTTRLVVMDLKGGDALLMAIEPAEGSTLEDLLATADDVAGSIRFR